MKKTLIALTVALSTSTAQALPPISEYVVANGQKSEYWQGYNTGYQHGKNDGKHKAYTNIGKAVVIIGAVAIVGTAIYHIGKNSRWTTTENGIGYRF